MCPQLERLHELWTHTAVWQLPQQANKSCHTTWDQTPSHCRMECNQHMPETVTAIEGTMLPCKFTAQHYAQCKQEGTPNRGSQTSQDIKDADVRKHLTCACPFPKTHTPTTHVGKHKAALLNNSIHTYKQARPLDSAMVCSWAPDKWSHADPLENCFT